MIQERSSQGERQESEYEVSVGVWQGSTLSSATLRLRHSGAEWLTLTIEINSDKLAAGFHFMC